MSVVTPTELPASAQELAVSRRMPLRAPPYDEVAARAIGNTAFSGTLSPQNLRLTLAQEPKLAIAFQQMAHVVLFKGSVPEREREIAIIRTGALTRSEYEWGMHVSIYAERCGLSEAQVMELTCNTVLSDALWPEKERLIVRMVDELHHHSTVGDSTWAALQAHWPKEQVIELVLASSFYHMAAFFLNSMAVPLEQGSRRFPPGLVQAFVPGDSTAAP